MSRSIYTVSVDSPVPARIDKLAAAALPHISRSQIDSERASFSLNGKPAKKSARAQAGDVIELTMESDEQELTAEPVELDILYEDEHVIALNKPQGMVVHPGAGHHHATLVHGLLSHCRHLAGPDPERPGIVHRLDKETSGTMIAAKDQRAYDLLTRQFASRRPRKRYIAIVKGNLRRRAGVVETLIGRDPRHRKRFTVIEEGGPGKPAKTEYQVLRRYEGYDLVSFILHTGRTHQLRVHAGYLGAPILGDPVYARTDRRFPEASLMLHSFSLEIIVPDEHDGEKKMVFRSPLPQRFKQVLRSLPQKSPADR